jgi:fluoride exporter
MERAAVDDESPIQYEEQPDHSAPPGRRDRMSAVMTYLIIGLGGFIGANARFVVGRWALQKWGGQFPLGTLLINVTGSFILGVFATLALHYAWDDRWRLLIAVGFVGAFTTFSTFEYETLELAIQGSWMGAGINVLGSVICGFVAGFVGIAAARLLSRGHF